MLTCCKSTHTSRFQICFLDRTGASQSSSSNYREMLNKAFCTDCSRQQNPELRKENSAARLHLAALQLQPGSVQDILTSSLGIFIKMTFPFLRVHSSTHIWQRTAVWTAFTSSQCICYASNDIMHLQFAKAQPLLYRPPKQSPRIPMGKMDWLSIPKVFPLQNRM